MENTCCRLPVKPVARAFALCDVRHVPFLTEFDEGSHSCHTFSKERVKGMFAVAHRSSRSLGHSPCATFGTFRFLPNSTKVLIRVTHFQKSG
ncbi:MAG: hypothetical protein IKR09_09215, partial [Alphaproteobacteria bacterium]|nr:hypothetical protein [Alphaproteobacteria bacterium]